MMVACFIVSGFQCFTADTQINQLPITNHQSPFCFSLADAAATALPAAAAAVLKVVLGAHSAGQQLHPHPSGTQDRKGEDGN